MEGYHSEPIGGIYIAKIVHIYKLNYNIDKIYKKLNFIKKGYHYDSPVTCILSPDKVSDGAKIVIIFNIQQKKGCITATLQT